MAYKLLLLLSIVINVIAQFLIKIGMKQTGAFDLKANMRASVMRIISNPLFLTGAALSILAFIPYAIALSKIELSTAFPVISIGAIILLFLFSVLFLGETFNLLKAAGVVFCVVGILLIFR
jgi:multidrug transporter EmrE-like cation transporter